MTAATRPPGGGSPDWRPPGGGSPDWRPSGGSAANRVAGHSLPALAAPVSAHTSPSPAPFPARRCSSPAPPACRQAPTVKPPRRIVNNFRCKTCTNVGTHPRLVTPARRPGHARPPTRSRRSCPSHRHLASHQREHESQQCGESPQGGFGVVCERSKISRVCGVPEFGARTVPGQRVRGARTPSGRGSWRTNLVGVTGLWRPDPVTLPSGRQRSWPQCLHVPRKTARAPQDCTCPARQHVPHTLVPQTASATRRKLDLIRNAHFRRRTLLAMRKNSAVSDHSGRQEPSTFPL